MGLLAAFVLLDVVGQCNEFGLQFVPISDKDSQFLIMNEVIDLSTECKDQWADPHETWNEFIHVLFFQQFENHLTEKEGCGRA